jgi:hypothetical protein
MSKKVTDKAKAKKMAIKKGKREQKRKIIAKAHKKAFSNKIVKKGKK